MCIEDIRLGRRTGTAVRAVPVGASSVVLCQANTKRVSITLFALAAQRYTFTDQGDAVLDSGPTINTGTGPVTLTVQSHGQLVTRELRAIASAAAQTVGVIEAYLQDD